MTKKEYIERYGQEAYNSYVESCKNYDKNHKEQKSASQKAWYKQNREHKIAYCKEWKKSNPDYMKDYYDFNLRGNPKRFCCEPLDKIENYELAAQDNFEGWDLHHKLEIKDGYINTRDDMKLMGIYYSRPACELIYLRHNDHARLHRHAEKLLSK